MTARTPKQQEAWNRRCALGVVSGLPRWINSQVCILCERPELDNERKKSLRRAAWYLNQQLGLSNNEIRFYKDFNTIYHQNMKFLHEHAEHKDATA